MSASGGEADIDQQSITDLDYENTF